MRSPPATVDPVPPEVPAEVPLGLLEAVESMDEPLVVEENPAAGNISLRNPPPSVDVVAVIWAIACANNGAIGRRVDGRTPREWPRPPSRTGWHGRTASVPDGSDRPLAGTSHRR
jgi:hypothetical protein